MKIQQTVISLSEQFFLYTCGIVSAYAAAALVTLFFTPIIWLLPQIPFMDNQLVTKLVMLVLVTLLGFATVTVATWWTDVSSRHISAWVFAGIAGFLFVHHRSLGHNPTESAEVSLLEVSVFLLGAFVAAGRFALIRIRAHFNAGLDQPTAA